MMKDILRAAGGLGAFLLGLNLLVEGLKGLAGPALRDSLARFTVSPLSGAITGAIATALVQSSSAITVMTVGFVSATLITFPQALGLIFGANVGATATGWLVSLIGFKLDLASVLAPAVLAGVVLRMFAQGRARHAGWALAGFGLMFAGLAGMQAAMAVFAEHVSPAAFPPDTIIGQLQSAGIGIVMAAVLQSSSAGVATALVALNAGAISFPQAAAFVIGLDIGTTVTALLATIGGSAATRRTGFAHVVFNLMTGLMAFALLPVWIIFSARWFDLAAASQANLALVGFHTAFNLLGCAIGVMFAAPFARLLLNLVHEEEPRGAQRFDPQLLAEPETAIEPLTMAARDVAALALDTLANILVGGHDPAEHDALEAIASEHAALETVLSQLRTSPGQAGLHERHLAILHVLDHAGRLIERMRSTAVIAQFRGPYGMKAIAEALAIQARKAAQACKEGTAHEELERFAEARFRRLEHEYRDRRLRVISEASEGRENIQLALDRLDALRWAGRAAYHVWRMVHHLGAAGAFRHRPAPQDMRG